MCGCMVGDGECFNVEFGDFFEGLLIVVLINGGLVLVFEIVVGVFQDY